MQPQGESSMPVKQPNTIRFTFGSDGVAYSAVVPGRQSEVEISMEEFKAISHFVGLGMIARAIEDLSGAVNGLAEALDQRK
jgi:hypothetical protein